jgi:hypothetical protein
VKEVELCDRFKGALKNVGWVVYPETSGWDLLCVGPEEVQIGVEAKARANVSVLNQALHGDVFPGGRRVGPDFHAVLVPKSVTEFRHVARLLHLLCFDLEDIEKNEDHFFLRLSALSYTDPRCWNHQKPEWVPPIVVDVPAGVPAPERVTRWKISAVKLCLRLRAQGYVTTRDFREFGVGFTEYWRWRLVSIGKLRVPKLKGEGTVWVNKYAPIIGRKLPDQEWPDIATSLQALDKVAA